MVSRVTPLNPSSAQVDSDGRMTDRFRLWSQSLTNQSMIVGTGSPDGVIGALQTAIYMDDAGTAGSILYIKRDSDVLGDTTKGWILV